VVRGGGERVVVRGGGGERSGEESKFEFGTSTFM
jgi:hypothetical protein